MYTVEFDNDCTEIVVLDDSGQFEDCLIVKMKAFGKVPIQQARNLNFFENNFSDFVFVGFPEKIVLLHILLILEEVRDPVH